MICIHLDIRTFKYLKEYLYRYTCIYPRQFNNSRYTAIQHCKWQKLQ